MFVADAMVFGMRTDLSGLNASFARAQQEGRAFSARMGETLSGAQMTEPLAAARAEMDALGRSAQAAGAAIDSVKLDTVSPVGAAGGEIGGSMLSGVDASGLQTVTEQLGAAGEAAQSAGGLIQMTGQQMSGASAAADQMAEPVKAVKEEMSKAGESAGGFGKKLLGLATAVGGILSLRAAIGTLTSSFENIDNTLSTADRLGVSMEAFAALSHQAKLANVDLSSLEMGLQKLMPAMAEAAAGSKTASEGFTKLGLDAGILVNLPVDQSLGMIADAIASIENPAQRAAAAVDIFGMRAGPQLLTLLMEGSAGIEAAKQHLEDLGGTISALDARAVQEAGDAIDDMKKSVELAANRIAVVLAPSIQAAAEVVATITGAVGNFIATVRGGESPLAKFSAAALGWGAALGGAVLIIPRLVSAIKTLVTAIRAVTQAQAVAQALAGPAGWATLAAGALIAAGAVAGIAATFDEISEAAGEATAAIGAVQDQAQAGAVLKIKVDDTSVKDALANLRKEFLAAQPVDPLQAFKPDTLQMDQAKDLIRATDVAEAWNAIEELNVAIRDLGKSSEQVTLDNLIAQFGEGHDTVEVFRQKLTELNTQQLQQDIDALNASLQQQVKWFGKSAAEISLLKLAQEGASASQLESARASMRDLKMLDVRQQIEEFGMSDKQIKLFDLKAMGADLNQLQQYADLLDELKKKQDSQGATESVKQWADGLKTPMEQLEAKLDELHKNKAAGLINEETFKTGIDAAKRELATLQKENAEIDMTPKIASFIRSGSQDAYKLQAEIAAQMQGRKDSDKIPRDQLEEAKSQTAVLERIEQKLDFTGGEWS